MSGITQQFQTVLRRPSGEALEAFMLLEGRYSNFTRETFFLRCAAGAHEEDSLARLDRWAGGTGKPGRIWERALPGQPSVAETGKYVALFQEGRFPVRFRNVLWQEALERGFRRILEQFKRVRGREEEAIVRNFAVRILYWMDLYFPRLFVETEKMNRFPKFACGGRVKLAEYLFLYLLFLLGCDVLYISPTGQVSLEDQELLALSLEAAAASENRTAAASGNGRGQGASSANGAPGERRITIPAGRFRRPERHAPAASPAPPPSPAASGGSVLMPVRTARSPAASSGDRRESRQALEFEELARFASSVVMLKVFDDHDQCFKTGSGVIINERGYVLTNMHVVSGGHHYGILLEEETDVFYTKELIKYHPGYDLAVLRMEKRRAPIPLSRGPALVRGQKVVAIGSPLGLFNSVSDGIISGFRELEQVSMIQFTAPVSHGSSGGALLNMYGELIGLITGGYDAGQNLNLAVGYQTIGQFAGGLL